MIVEIKNHRSIRKFSDKPIPKDVMTSILEAATRASTCGNMQCYSMIVTQSPDKLKTISPLHFGQVERMNAQCVVTVCADMYRFSKWCEQRDAKPQYDNFLWYVNGAIDGMMAAQNLTLEAEAQGLGICVLGTTLYTADKMVEIFNLPAGVIPVTAIALGYPDEQPPLTDRLPLEGVVHYESYNHYTAHEIDELWREREESEQTKSLLEENNLPNLAQIFTLNRYKGDDNKLFSAKYVELLKSQYQRYST
ncbi:MAG: nitroreductase family protein, partial [Rikenellaceae bacterium]